MNSPEIHFHIQIHMKIQIETLFNEISNLVHLITLEVVDGFLKFFQV